MKIYRNLEEMKNDYKDYEDYNEEILNDPPKRKYKLLLFILIIIILLNLILPIKTKPLVGFGHLYKINIANKEISHKDVSTFKSRSFLNILEFSDTYEIVIGEESNKQKINLNDIDSFNIELYICTNIYGTNQENCNNKPMQVKIGDKATIEKIIISKNNIEIYNGMYTKKTYKYLLETGLYDIIIEGRYINTKSKSSFKLEVI